MAENTGRRIRLIYGICLTVLTVAVGALFIGQVWSIFLLGEKSFTVENISAHFAAIALPVWAWVAAVVLGGALSAVFPDQPQKPKAYVETQLLLSRLRRRVAEDESLTEAKKQANFRIALGWVCVGLCAVATGVCLAVLLDPTYTPRFNSEFFKGHDGAADRLVRIVPWIAAAFVAACLVSFALERSRKREIKLLKEAVARKKAQNGSAAPVQKTVKQRFCDKFAVLRSPKVLLVARIGLCVVGIALFVVGIFDGGMADVFEKAKNICTQCIGLG